MNGSLNKPYIDHESWRSGTSGGAVQNFSPNPHQMISILTSPADWVILPFTCPALTLGTKCKTIKAPEIYQLTSAKWLFKVQFSTGVLMSGCYKFKLWYFTMKTIVSSSSVHRRSDYNIEPIRLYFIAYTSFI